MSRAKGSESKIKVDLMNNVDLSTIMTPALPSPQFSGTKG